MLFVIIIISSILKPSFFLLIGIYTMVNWIGMTYLMRAEFYREKAKPYVAAALSMGQSNFKIMFKHILANSLVPIITYFPFSVVAGISALVGLDYLGFWSCSSNTIVGADARCWLTKYSQMVDGFFSSNRSVFNFIINCFYW